MLVDSNDSAVTLRRYQLTDRRAILRLADCPAASGV